MSQRVPGLALGTGVLALQVRSPGLLAMAAASLQALTADRDVLLGIGVSSPVVAGDWHGAAYPDKPLAQMREFLAVLRECLSGEPVTFAGDFYQLRKFRLGVDLPGRRPTVIVGALGEGMLRLAGEAVDGVLLNYLPVSHVSWCVQQVRRGGGATIYANVHVGVGDRVAAAPQARRDLFSYAVVDAYARSFSQAVPDQMIDAIDVVGSPALVSDTVAAYRRAGVQVPVIFLLTWGAARNGQPSALDGHAAGCRSPRGACRGGGRVVTGLSACRSHGAVAARPRPLASAAWPYPAGLDVRAPADGDRARIGAMWERCGVVTRIGRFHAPVRHLPALYLAAVLADPDASAVAVLPGTDSGSGSSPTCCSARRPAASPC